MTNLFVTSPFLRSPALLCSFHSRNYVVVSSRSSCITMVKELPLRCSVKRHHSTDHINISRRSADYQPNVWDYDFLGSLPTQDFKTEKFNEERRKMIVEVKDMINCWSMDTLSRLELVDAIDRLGLKRHFQEEIKTCVKMVHCEDDTQKLDEDLYATALRFRVLRQHGYLISEDVFGKFKDKEGNIGKAFSKDTRGLLSLYEASFLECRGDESLEEIRDFAGRRLKEQLNNLPPKWAKEVGKALHLPLHWRFPRLKARWSIDAYDDHRFHPTLIRLAKLDFNMVQSAYKEEIKQLVRWWKEMELPRKLPYARDRLMEHYLWTVGIIEDPEYHHYRLMEAKVVDLITALDDTYDVYGTLEELHIFTHLIDRWEINGIDQLPEPMKHCYLAIYNTSNEIDDQTFKEKGFHIIPYLSKSWARLCKTYLQEAKWYYEGYKPNLTEYLHNAIVSIGAHLMLLDSYLFTQQSISKEAIDYINDLPNLVRCGATVIRLSNDLATSSDELARGDATKALECYMNETGASEKVARDHITGLIKETWKKMNEEYYLMRPQYPCTTISDPFLEANLNLARSSQFFYSFKKDWHGKPDKEMMDHIKLLLIDHIPM